MERYKLIRVVRSDGHEVMLDDNAWTTHRTIRLVGETPYRQHRLHILDKDSTGSYTLVYSVTSGAAKAVSGTKMLADGSGVMLTGENAPVITGCFKRLLLRRTAGQSIGDTRRLDRTCLRKPDGGCSRSAGYQA